MRIFEHCCRTPHGVRELKQFLGLFGCLKGLCRTPHGVRELKLAGLLLIFLVMCRTPHGVRELKLLLIPVIILVS